MRSYGWSTVAESDPPRVGNCGAAALDPSSSDGFAAFGDVKTSAMIRVRGSCYPTYFTGRAVVYLMRSMAKVDETSAKDVTSMRRL